MLLGNHAIMDTRNVKQVLKGIVERVEFEIKHGIYIFINKKLEIVDNSILITKHYSAKM